MIGQEVGSYKITDKIGEGGMGSVFKGIDVMLEREVAIKMLRSELASQSDVVERFRTEAVTLAKLNHPNIAILYSFLREGDDYFMVMEYVRGETLDEVLRKSGAISCERAVSLFCKALEGIDHAHRLGIIHRDIKPANMMLTETGELKVMDFGIARVLGTSRLTKHGNIIGTIEYMSPEQVRGDETDTRSDIYSLGILLYEMLTGHVPFNSKSEFELMRAQIEDAPTPPTVLVSEIPLPLEQAIMRSLAKKPEARFQTANEFRAHLLTTTGKGTGQIDNEVYRAPTTRIMEPFREGKKAEEASYKTNALGEGAPETRLDQTSALMGATETGPIAEPKAKKNTAEGPLASETVGLSPEQAQAAASGQQAQAETLKPQASLLSKLNWMHYAAAVVVLLLLIGVPLAIIGGGGQEAAVETPAVQDAGQSPASDQNATPPGAQNNQPAIGAAPNDGKSNRPRNAEDEKAAENPTAAAPPTQTEPPKEGDVAAAKEEEKKKEEAKKEEEKKAGGVGGFFKKINPFKGDDKKEEEKKKEGNKNAGKKP